MNTDLVGNRVDFCVHHVRVLALQGIGAPFAPRQLIVAAANRKT